MTAYYNEIDSFAAAWLRELIKAKLIAPGEVDERSIDDVAPNDLNGFTQCHFFAGIGGWSYAIRLAGWPDDRPVWTGSCPCQPFSAAGKGKGFADERHLWPEFFRLIAKCRPGVVFGEQVASKDGLSWLDLVCADLEGAGYAVGAVDTCAAGFGAPHIRQRLYWVADTRSVESRRRGEPGGEESQGGEAWPGLGMGVELERMADASSGQLQEQIRRPERRDGAAAAYAENRLPSPTNGFWRDADWLFCRDGRWRPVEPGSFPLAHWVPNRVGKLRGYGNAIVAPQAAEFIKSVMV